MESNNEWYHDEDSRVIWWRDSDYSGEWIFSFDRKKEYNLFADYPHNMTAEEVEIFSREYPYWREFFADRFDGR